MNKTQVKKEVAAIRKLVAQIRRLERSLSVRQHKLVKKACPFKPGDPVEWTHANGTIDRGIVHCTEPGKIYSEKTNQQYSHLWVVTVQRYRRGTTTFALGRERIRENSKVQLRAYVPPKPDPSKRRYRPLPWLNTKTEKEMFGIQISVEAGAWKHLAIDGKPAVYATKAERDKKMEELRAAK